MLAVAVLLSFLGPESLIEKGGLVLLALIVFAESGLLIGFFLPGDSLLFIAGGHDGGQCRGAPVDLPVARTFTPIVAGVGTMRYSTFLTYNVAGGTLWGAGVTMLGFFFGDTHIVRENFELAILAVIMISLLPVVVEFVRHRRTTIRSAALGQDWDSPVGVVLVA